MFCFSAFRMSGLFFFSDVPNVRTSDDSAQPISIQISKVR